MQENAMPRSKSGRRSPRGLDKTDEVDEISPAVPDAGDDISSAIASVAAPAPPAAKVVQLPKEPEITLSVYARRRRGDAIMKAFIHCETLAHKLTRKQTRTAWDAEFKIFLEKPRS
jgi:hypothetical protein